MVESEAGRGSVYPVGFKTAIGIFKRGGGSEGACTFRAGIRSEAARAQQATEAKAIGTG